MHFLQTCDKLQCGTSVSACYYFGERRVALFLVGIFIASFFVDILFLAQIYRNVFPLGFVVRHCFFCSGIKSKQGPIFTFFPATSITYILQFVNHFYVYHSAMIIFPANERLKISLTRNRLGETKAFVCSHA